LNDRRAPDVAAILPHALEDLSHDVRLNQTALETRVHRRRRKRAARRWAAAGIGAFAIIVGVVGFSAARAPEQQAKLRVAAGVPREQTTTSRPGPSTPHSNSAADPYCTRPIVSSGPPGLTVQFRPATSSIGADGLLRGAIQYSNSSSAPLSVETAWPTALIESSGQIVGAGREGSDPSLPTVRIGYATEVPPNGDVSIDLTVKLASCDGAASGLTPGNYLAYVTVPASIDAAGVMVAAPVPITVS
jgi:hypothetical protein